MESQKEIDFAARQINKVVPRLVGKAGIRYDDLPDLRQEIWTDLLERLPDYRPDRGHIRAFIVRVIKNKVASILKARAAAKRGDGRPCLSLDWEFEDEGGAVTNLHETLSLDDYLRRTRGTVRSEEERGDLALDVRTMVNKLLPRERVTCLLLIDRDVTDVSELMGLSRSTLRDSIKRLRRIADKAGLRKYFE